MKTLNLDNFFYIVALFAIFFGIFAELTIATEYLRNIKYYSYTLLILVLSFTPIYWLVLTNKIKFLPPSINVVILSIILIVLILILFLDPLNIFFSKLLPLSNLMIFIKVISLSFLVLYFLSFADEKRNFIKHITSSYIYFSYYISISGITAFILVNLNIINPTEWVEITQNFKKYDEGDNVQFDNLKGLYSFPYYLSLVLTGDNKVDILGFSFYRLSGLSIEPGVATFLMTPAFFLAINYNRNSYFPLLILIFILLCFSVANIIILISLFVLYSSKKIISSIGIYFFIIIFILFFFFWNEIFNDYFSFIVGKFSGDSMSNLLSEWSIFKTSTSIVGFHIFSERDYNIENSILIFLLVWMLFFMMVGYLIIYYLASEIKFYQIFPLLYILMHSIKSPISFLFTYFFWYILILSIFLVVRDIRNSEK